MIRVHVFEEEKEVLTLIGLKPKSLKYLEDRKIESTLKYVSQSIKGAVNFDVSHEDMSEVESYLINEMKNKTAIR